MRAQIRVIFRCASARARAMELREIQVMLETLDAEYRMRHFHSISYSLGRCGAQTHALGFPRISDSVYPDQSTTQVAWPTLGPTSSDKERSE